MTAAEAVKTLVTSANTNSLSQNYSNPDDQLSQTSNNTSRSTDEEVEEEANDKIMNYAEANSYELSSCLIIFWN